MPSSSECCLKVSTERYSIETRTYPEFVQSEVRRKGVEGERLMGVHELVDFREFVRVAIVSSQSASGGGSGDGDSMRRIS